MKINNKQIAFFCILTWVFLIVFMILDSLKIFGSDIGITQSLKTSSLARAMFMDIGVLSSIIAAWIAFGTTLKFRHIFAVAALFVGSFAVLPFLAYYFYNKS